MAKSLFFFLPNFFSSKLSVALISFGKFFFAKAVAFCLPIFSNKEHLLSLDQEEIVLSKLTSC